MTGARYGAKAADGAEAKALAQNPAHGLRSTFTREGLRLEVRSGEATHQVAWRLDSLGYGAAQITVPAGELKVSGQRVELARGPSPTPHSALRVPHLVEWFNNTPGGLEHGFTLAERPAANPRGEALSLVLAVTGDLAPQADAAGQNLLLRDAAGQTVLTYEKLKVWDATGAELPATMQVADGKVTLTVPEANAHYPLTIDPTFAQEAYLKASNTGGSDWFGRSVAVSGDTVVVGAGQESSNATGVNGNDNDNSLAYSGAAYVFVRTGMTWTQQAYLKASNTDASDFFGYAVAVSGDTVVVGAVYEASNATGINGDQSNNSLTYSGAAYVFVRSGTNWTQQAYLKASNAGAFDEFGWSVAVSGDTVVVGAHYESSNTTGINGNGNDNSAMNSGAAYVFVRSGTTWSQQAYLKASNTGAGDQFGISVAVSGNTVVVGAFFESSNATGINGNGNDNSLRYSGAAYVFVRNGATWTQQAYLKASNTGSNDGFGYEVDVSGDTVVVGAWSEDSNATGVNGNGADNSADFSGAAYVFVRSGTTWSQQAYLKASNTGAGDQFGISVAVSGDTVVVGANNEASNATGINGNGNDNSLLYSGAAYVFVRNGATWSQQAYLKASNTGANDRFGVAVAVSSGTVVVGANNEASNATGVNPGPVAEANNSAINSGAVYIFQLPSVQVPRMDVVQVIQEADGSVPLIRGKATFVRAYLRSPEELAGGKPLEVQLRGQLRSPIDPGIITDLAVLQAYDRQSLRKTAIKMPGEPIEEIVSFELPNDWSSMDGLELILEQLMPVVPLAQARPVFQAVPDLRLRIYAAEWTHEGQTLQASSAVVLDSVDLVKSMMPVSNVVLEILPLKLDSSEVGDLSSVNQRLVTLRSLDGLPTGSGPIDYALISLPEGVPNPGGNLEGVADGIPGDVASGFGSGGPRSPIVHELAHCLGRHHAVPAGGAIGPCPSAGAVVRFLADFLGINFDAKSGVCLECASLVAPDFPYFDTNPRTHERFASIGLPNSDELLLARGLSTYRGNPRDTPYDEVAELMSYCSAPETFFKGARLPSKFTYEGLIEGLRGRAIGVIPRSDLRVRLSARAAPSESWLVRGRFDGPGNSLRLMPVVTVPGGSPMGVVPGGPLQLLVLGATGQELARHSLTVSFGLEPGVTPGFLVIIPQVPGARELRVVHQTMQLANQTFSLHAPTVKILSPNGGEILDQERVTIRWVGIDADADALTYTVQLSRDGGLSWGTLDTDLMEFTFDLPRQFLKGGSNHLIRVIANDGILTGSDTSDGVFRVTDSPPVALIRSPSGEETFKPTDTIRFRGTGWDPESGVVDADSRFRWESDRDGLLINGRASFDRAASELY
ncbi:MAG: hypothetical protein EXS36_20425 [Pedosphaera sp.]|nr:hypothetical protein [Pedosphaera sp.]